MNAQEFIQLFKDGRAAWDECIANIPPAQIETSINDQGWTIKDAISHVNWFEREMVQVIGQRALVGSDLWNLPPDERNAAIYKELKDIPISDVLTENTQVYQDLLPLIQSLTDEELHNPARFKDMPPDWDPANIIAGNTYEHYPEHIQAIQNGLNNS